MYEKDLHRIRDEWELRYTAKPLPLSPFAFGFLVALAAVLLSRG